MLQRPLWQICHTAAVWLLSILGLELGIQKKSHYAGNTELQCWHHKSAGKKKIHHYFFSFSIATCWFLHIKCIYSKWSVFKTFCKQKKKKWCLERYLLLDIKRRLSAPAVGMGTSSPWSKQCSWGCLCACVCMWGCNWHIFK